MINRQQMDEEGPGEQIFLESRTQQHLTSEASQLNLDDLTLMTGAGSFVELNSALGLRLRGSLGLDADIFRQGSIYCDPSRGLNFGDRRNQLRSLWVFGPCTDIPALLLHLVC